mmetsp:Transcript_193/g.338  ORF Transcript_193/g.338 Transcript_193/m.338 type:complete len:94 (-) Transcript_193:958-1239(-)
MCSSLRVPIHSNSDISLRAFSCSLPANLLYSLFEPFQLLLYRRVGMFHAFNFSGGTSHICIRLAPHLCVGDQWAILLGNMNSRTAHMAIKYLR